MSKQKLFNEMASMEIASPIDANAYHLQSCLLVGNFLMDIFTYWSVYGQLKGELPIIFI